MKRVHGLNTMAKELLAELSNVTLRTPMSPQLSSGMICFEVDGIDPQQVVAHLRERGVIASTTPYHVSYARIAPSIINDEAEVRETVDAVAALQ